MNPIFSSVFIRWLSPFPYDGQKWKAQAKKRLNAVRTLTNWKHSDSGLQRQNTAGMQLKTSELLFLFLPTWILGKNKIKAPLLFNKRVDSELTLTTEPSHMLQTVLRLPKGRVVAPSRGGGSPRGALMPSALSVPSDLIKGTCAWLGGFTDHFMTR